MIELAPNEKIIKVVRKHWFVLLKDIFILVTAVAVPVILLFALHYIPIEKIFSFSSSTAIAGGFFLFLWLLIIWITGWKIWTDYYLDVLLITDKRIFDIQQQGFFKRLSSSFRIDRIQNVTIDMKGIIQTLLDFGTIRIETAGEREDFIAPFIANPYEIKKFINSLQDQALDKTRFVRIDTNMAIQKNNSLHSSDLSAIEKLYRDDSEGL